MLNGRRRWYVRIRRDHPEIEDGQEKKKYVATYSDRKHLYFPPMPELFADTNVPIILVEAEKSVLALVAWAEREGRKLLPLGVGRMLGLDGESRHQGYRNRRARPRARSHSRFVHLPLRQENLRSARRQLCKSPAGPGSTQRSGSPVAKAGSRRNGSQSSGQ